MRRRTNVQHGTRRLNPAARLWLGLGWMLLGLAFWFVVFYALIFAVTNP